MTLIRGSLVCSYRCRGRPNLVARENKLNLKESTKSRISKAFAELTQGSNIVEKKVLIFLGRSLVDVNRLLLRHVKRNASPVLSQRLAEYRSVSVTQYLLLLSVLSFSLYTATRSLDTNRLSFSGFIVVSSCKTFCSLK
jgi:hypothetical protein